MMDWLNGLHWREPAWLALALLPWLLQSPAVSLLLERWRRRARPPARLAAYADAHLLRGLLVGPAGPAASNKVFLAAWMLAAVAVAGPYWSRAAAPAETRGIDLAVIIDISPSMAVADLTPNRLARVKHELRDLIAQLGGDRLGLVVFSANAYPALPLTADRDAFLQFVDLLDPGLTAKPGSNLARATEVAGQLLAASPRDSRAALLISDGEFHDAEAASAAAALRGQGIPLFTVGVGTPSGGPVPDLAGHFMRYDDQVVMSRLDHTRLQQLARDGGGHYVQLREDDDEWRELITALRAATHAGRLASPAAAVDAIPLYIAPLAASLVLFLWAGARRREALAMLVLPLLIIVPPPGEAAPSSKSDIAGLWTEREAYEALQKQDYAQARKLYDQVKNYRGWLGAGTAAYRLQDWNTALAAFEKAARQTDNDDEKAHALYNVGNALARLERFQQASERYQAALHLKPNLSQAALNLSLVNQFLDVRRGQRERKDAEHAAANLGGQGSERAESTSSGRGDAPDSVSAAASAAKGNPQQQRERTGAAQARREPQLTQQTDAARLEKTLALWREAGAGLGGRPPELETLRDNNAEFLRWRFREDDLGSHVKMMGGKPW